MRDEGEVGEAALDAGLQDGAGPRVAQGSPVLGQQVCKLLTKLSAGEKTQRDVILGFPQNNNTTTTSVLSFYHIIVSLYYYHQFSQDIKTLKKNQIILQLPPLLHLLMEQNHAYLCKT